MNLHSQSSSRPSKIHQVAELIVNVLTEQDERINQLETFIRIVSESPKEDKIYTVKEAAAFLRIKSDSLRKARRNGRIKGVPLNEKEWGFLQSEIERYLKRYNRIS